MATGSQDHTFVWHDLMSTNPEVAEPFHTQLFGFEADAMEMMDYHVLKAGGAGFGGIMKWDREGIPSHWIGHILVGSVDETGARATELGGQVVDGPRDLPNIGRFSVIMDPQGAAFVIFEKAHADMPMNEAVPMEAEGKVLWNELMTTDVDGAVAFYTGLFGWGTQVTDVGTGPYTMGTLNGVPIVGIFEKPADVPVSSWAPYFHVADIDGALAKAGELGGQVMMPVMEVPTVGKLAWIADPTGAATAIMQPSEEM